MEKRNIQISLEEAIEWYNSDNSFKKELALKAYSETELSISTYSNILALLKNEAKVNSISKGTTYKKLLNIAKYYSSIYPIDCDSHLHTQNYYIITKTGISAVGIIHKDFVISKCVYKSGYEIAFNSSEAAKKAIDILGDELNILFE